MDSLLQSVQQHWRSAIEILLLSIGIYYAWRYFRGTRGARVLIGLIVFQVGITLLSQWLQLQVIGWLIGRFSVFFVIALVVIFQPELRRALAEIGSKPFFTSGRQNKESMDELCECVFDLAGKQCGALLAIERDIGVRSYAESGVMIDCVFSPELVRTIFHPKTPLHDGGLILQDSRIIAAGCIFPVSQRESLDRSFGLRHRAGLGISEETDAVAVVVSEETGSVSICFDGKIERGLSPGEFRRRLGVLLLGEKAAPREPAASSASKETRKLDAA